MAFLAFFKVLCHYFTYFWGPGIALEEPEVRTCNPPGMIGCSQSGGSTGLKPFGRCRFNFQTACLRPHFCREVLKNQTSMWTWQLLAVLDVSWLGLQGSISNFVWSVVAALACCARSCRKTTAATSELPPKTLSWIAASGPATP